ncbi:UDP binding domain-containing protein [Patescibacteria group bacterium]
MSEKLGSNEPQNSLKLLDGEDRNMADLCISSIRTWMGFDPEVMQEVDTLTIFYGNTLMLIETLEEKAGMDLESIRQRFRDKIAEFKELVDLQSRGLETEIPEEELMYKPTMRKVMVEQPRLIKPKSEHNTCTNPYEVCDDSDALLILTEWEEFRGIDLKKARRLMKGDTLIDGRNIYDPDEVRAAGFNYLSMGL